METTFPAYVASKAVTTAQMLVVTNKSTGQPAFRAALAGGHEVESAISAASQAFEQTRRMPTYKRQAVLQHLCRRATENLEALARTLSIEVGKTLREARGEVQRMIETFRLSAEEAGRIGGEIMPVDFGPRYENFTCLWKRVPIGPCSFITPFNFPLNLAAHKIGPAIATGCPFVLKPASNTPISTLMLGPWLAETEWPVGAFSILPCRADDAAPLIRDDRMKLLSFTGSPKIGWALKSQAGRKRVCLELGGNAACIVDSGVDLDRVADRILFGAFAVAGQSCISVQRILAHGSVLASLRTKLAERISSLRMGDPLDEATTLGPMISEADAQRIEAWVSNAVSRGSRLICGGKRHGSFFEATLLEDVPADCELSCEEVFGPIAVLSPFDNFDQAIQAANATRFGLQAGVFTQNLNHAMRAFEQLEVGGVVLNDVPTMRADAMPYGGVKESGFGREGIRFAMEEMTEIKNLLVAPGK